MPWTEPVTVTLPGHQAETIRALVAAGQARSVSAWIAEAIAARLREVTSASRATDIDLVVNAGGTGQSPDPHASPTHPG